MQDNAKEVIQASLYTLQEQAHTVYMIGVLKQFHINPPQSSAENMYEACMSKDQISKGLDDFWCLHFIFLFF